VAALYPEDLRHTDASLLLAVGVNPKGVSERLGHSSVAFTLDTYAHVIPGMQPDAAQTFIDLVYRDEWEPRS
jgi:integrase